MKTRQLFSLTCIGALCITYLGAGRIAAQSSTPGSTLQATITSASGAERHLPSHNYVVDRVGLGPNQMVTVTLQFPTDLSGKPVRVASLDGGEATADHRMEDLFVGEDGTLAFYFQAGSGPGLYRIMVHQEGDDYRLEFWVLDPDHPQNNPPRVRIVD